MESYLLQPLWRQCEPCVDIRLDGRRSRTTRGRELGHQEIRLETQRLEHPEEQTSSQVLTEPGCGSGTSVQQSELAVERPQQLPVPRSVMSRHGCLKGPAPNRRAPRTHPEGRQLKHTWNTEPPSEPSRTQHSVPLNVSVCEFVTKCFYRFVLSDPH